MTAGQQSFEKWIKQINVTITTNKDEGMKVWTMW